MQTNSHSSRGQFALLVRGFLIGWATTIHGARHRPRAVGDLAVRLSDGPGFIFAVWFTPDHAAERSPADPDIVETTHWRLVAVFIGLTMSAAGLVAAAVWDGLTLQRRVVSSLFAAGEDAHRDLRQARGALLFSGVLALATMRRRCCSTACCRRRQSFSVVVRAIAALIVTTTSSNLRVLERGRRAGRPASDAEGPRARARV
jgi:hypothetical protein